MRQKNCSNGQKNSTIQKHDFIQIYTGAGERRVYVSICSEYVPERYIRVVDCLWLLEQFRDGLSFGQ